MDPARPPAPYTLLAVIPGDDGLLGDEGFTLIEALVATTLTIALVAIALSGFVAAYGTLTRGAARSAGEDAALVGRQRLAADLAHATRVVVYAPDSLRVWDSAGATTAYTRRDSALLRGAVPILPDDLTAYAFEVRAVSVSGDTLWGTADTDVGDVGSVRVAARTGTARSTVAWSVEVSPRSRTVWPERVSARAWPEQP